ncbi:hypothetical protein JCM30237_18950 [Halolamina litorea]|uniref:histidine kinase n=1 Tax=Halolamina litorea TaxID=1515593 RepID=A0ABD6BX09_9EURY|nr:PAS domain S-box protein [Halolamina litorea]
MDPSRTSSPPRIALDIARDRNRELLTKLLTDCEVVEFSGPVPDGTDLCIIDAAAVERSGERFEEWRTEQSPVFAPVALLLEGGPSTAPSESGLREHVDSLFRVPMQKAELAARIENLLRMREFSRDLEAERKLTELVFESSPLAKLVLEPDGTVIRANTRAGEVVGLDPTDLIGRKYDNDRWTALSADGTPVPTEELPFKRVRETDSPVYGFEHVVSRPDHDDMWVSVNMAPIRDESDGIAYVVAVIEDITVRRTQAQELERQIDLFRKAGDIANVGAWEYDLRAEEHWGTREVKRIHGLPDDADLTPERSIECYHPEDRPVIEAAFERAVEEGVPYDLELRLVGDDGEQRWIRTRGEPQREDGEVVRIRGTVQEITDRKERERQLLRMKNAVDEAPVGIALTDPAQEDNPLIYVNDQFVELTGYGREEAIGRNCRFLQGEDTDPETVARLRRKIEAEEPVSVTIRNYRADGSAFWNRLDVAPVRDEDGTVVNYIGFQQDVTDAQVRDRQLQILDRYLRHNVRNKMNVVNGLADSVREEGDPSVAAYADTIERTGLTLLRNMEKEHVITNFLRQDPEPTTTDLMGLLGSTVADVREQYPAASVTLSGPGSVSVEAVPQLSTALAELVRNAIIHNDSASPTVEVTVEAGEEAVRVHVADDGPGIPEMESEVLADADAETVVNHGQGLGLWLVYLVVSHSGGSLNFAEREPEGTVVTVELPRGD